MKTLKDPMFQLCVIGGLIIVGYILIALNQ